MIFPLIKFRDWMYQRELFKFAKALTNYWRIIQNSLQYPLQRLDPMTSDIEIVKLMAWERDVEPLAQETEIVFRTRVAYAFSFALNGGEVSGFTQMFERLGIGYTKQIERQDNVDWDVITIEAASSDLSDNAFLMNAVIRQYGRTCRRYFVNVTFPENINIRHAQFSHSQQIYTAELPTK